LRSILRAIVVLFEVSSLCIDGCEIRGRGEQGPTDNFGVRASFKRRGRKPKTVDFQDRWFKKKQRERNRIEGGFGNGKEHYRLDGVRYRIKDGSEIWVRAGILAMNLKSAASKA
jgi:hypothetical protein